MTEKGTPVLADISPIFRDRWSPRSFDSERKIERDEITKIFEAARWSPSCFNDQPWRFIVGDRYTDEEGWKKILSFVNEWNRGWAKNCPLLCVILHDTRFQKNGKDNKWGAYDTGAAAVTLAYQAFDLGIYSHQMGGFDKEAVSSTFDIPERYEAISVMGFGYYSHSAEGVDDEYAAGDNKARERRAPEEIIFAGEWGVPLYSSKES